MSRPSIPTRREDLIDQIKACGESIITNAESIVGTERFVTSLTVTIFVERDEIPRINVDRDFLPERRNLC